MSDVRTFAIENQILYLVIAVLKDFFARFDYRKTEKMGSTHLISCNVFNGELESLDDSSKYLSTLMKRFCSGWAYSSGCVEGLESSLELWLCKAPIFPYRKYNEWKNKSKNQIFDVWFVDTLIPTKIKINYEIISSNEPHGISSNIYWHILFHAHFGLPWEYP